MEPRACSFVPPYLLARVASAHGAGAEACRRTLEVDEGWRVRRQGLDASPPAARGLDSGSPVEPRDEAARRARPAGWSSGVETTRNAWTVHTAEQDTTLPGRPVRAAGTEPSGDVAVDEAAAGIAATLEMWRDDLGRASYDDLGAEVLLTVHYGRDYANAFWDGEHLVFGDGDGEVFGRFTEPVGVLAHEFGHAVVEHTAGLVYRDQPGALNESVSDAFAACLRQRVLGQTADEGDWLVGEGLFLPGVQARALRDMAAPGTAYDDPRLGRDPQPGHMDDYVETTEDSGGVHINSGIPNRAFVLAARAIGGTAVEGAGRVWLAALQASGPQADFAAFAAATVAAAGEHSDVVRTAWEEVGVRPGSTPAPASPAPASGGSTVVRVVRSGGLMGRTTTGEVDLASADPRVTEVQPLVDRVDLAGPRGGAPRPDMFVFSFEVCGSGPVQVPEQQLTDDLRELARIVLGPPTM